MKTQQIRQMCRQAFDKLIADLEAGRSDSMKKYLQVMARFHQYSLFNQMLILQQRPEAQHVSGFWTWKKLGRSVVKGAKGIAIMAPILYRRKNQAEEENQEDDSTGMEIVKNFRVVHVFDIADTSGAPLPQPSLAKGDPGFYLERLKLFTESQGIRLETRPLYGSTQGYALSGVIVLKSGLSPAESCSTLLHELSHQLLHIQPKVNNLDRNTKELEAEAVAFVVGTGIGLEMGTSSSDYISLYNGKKDDLLHGCPLRP